jgi:hypothetical protein
MVAAHPVGAVLGHGQAVTETGLGGAGRVLLGGMPELKNLRWTVVWCTAWDWKTRAASKG